MSSKLPLSIMTGKTILERWGCDEKQFFFILRNGLIRHMYKAEPTRPWDFMSWDILILLLVTITKHYKPFGDLAYSADDVYSSEESFPKLNGGKWKEDIISVAELEDSWGYRAIEITEILSKSEINPVDPTGSALDMDNLLINTESHGLVSHSDWLYLRSKGAEVEREYSIRAKISTLKKRKLTHAQRCKEKCRKIAKEKWEENPKITIKEMIEDADIAEVSKNKKGIYYTEKTVRKWIADLCPNRKPGRRPNKK